MSARFDVGAVRFVVVGTTHDDGDDQPPFQVRREHCVGCWALPSWPDRLRVAYAIWERSGEDEWDAPTRESADRIATREAIRERRKARGAYVVLP